jgi:hypothetical protein
VLVCKHFYRIAGGISEQLFNGVLTKVLAGDVFHVSARIPCRGQPWYTTSKDDLCLGALDSIYSSKFVKYDPASLCKFHYRSTWKALYNNEFAACFPDRSSMVTIDRFYVLIKTHRKLFKKSPRLRPRKLYNIIAKMLVFLSNHFDDAGGFNHQVCNECTKFEVQAEKISDKNSAEYKEITALHSIHYERAVSFYSECVS